jgi:hypothetical protein
VTATPTGRPDPAPRDPAWALHADLTSPAADAQHQARLTATRTTATSRKGPKR